MWMCLPASASAEQPERVLKDTSHTETFTLAALPPLPVHFFLSKLQKMDVFTSVRR